jgi:hypothetical protein
MKRISVKPETSYDNYLMTALTEEATVDTSIITGRSSTFLTDRLAVSP